MPFAVPSPRSSISSRPSPTGRRMVLVVDDDPGVLHTTARLIRRRSVAVVEAGDGIEALRQLDEHPAICLVLLDWHMPGLSGCDLLHAMRQHRPELCVLIATGDVPAIELDEYTGYLPKPFRYDLLHGAVDAALRDEPLPATVRQ